MTYTEWVNDHAIKHQTIMQKLTDLCDDEVIEYFRFENMLIAEPDFCPLYAEGKKCHDIASLNCYLCACPHFVFDDDGLYHDKGHTTYSKCSIDSKKATLFTSDTATHLDCSACILPHNEKYVKKHFSRDWLEAIGNVEASIS